ncbi:MAG TPA: hypothetical protein VNO21_24785, partial [Polyangiaceae bacterium]|nr:hypothetical protein [Polyangiaceae bacterium]
MAARASRSLIRALLAGAAAAVASGALGGCAHPTTSADAMPRGSLRTPNAAAKADPTVTGARLVPENIDEGALFGLEPGGGVRSIVAGVRIVSQANGALLAADD